MYNGSRRLAWAFILFSTLGFSYDLHSEKWHISATLLFCMLHIEVRTCSKRYYTTGKHEICYQTHHKPKGKFLENSLFQLPLFSF